MTSQLNVLQSFDVPCSYAQAKYLQEKKAYYKKNQNFSKIPSVSQFYKNPSIVDLTNQQSDTGCLAVCISNCVVIFQPVSGKEIYRKAQQNAKYLLPHLHQLENRAEGNRDQVFPINIPTSVLSNSLLKTSLLNPQDVVDLNDVVYQERFTIVHDFLPSCCSFVSHNAGEFLLVGGDMLVLWRILENKFVSENQQECYEEFSKYEYFAPLDILTLSDYNPDLYKFLNEQIDCFKSSKNEEDIKKVKLIPIPESLRSVEGSSLYIHEDKYNPLTTIPYSRYPYGHVPEWFDDKKSYGNQKYRILWIKTKIPAICQISFSPDIRLFATVGYHDHNVKVWYYGPSGLSFIYLSHSSLVASIQWHNYATYRNFNKNVLLISLIDGTCTLWEESEPWSRLRFDLKLNLNEPVSCVQWLLPPVFHLTEFLDQDKLSKSSNSDIIKTSWIRNTESFEPSFEYQNKEQLNSYNVFDCLHRVCVYSSMNRHFFIPLKSSPMVVQDWIVGLKKDGSILIWKMKGLGVPKCMLMITLWSHLKHVLSMENENFYSQLVVMSLKFSFVNHLYHPSLIKVYTYSATKLDFLCWTVDTSVINRGQATLYKRVKGHSSSIVDIQAHPTLPLVCSSDTTKTLIWKLNDTNVRSSDSVMQSVCSLPQNSLSVWDQGDALIYCYLSPDYTIHPGIYIYLVDIAEEDGFTLCDRFTPQLIHILEDSANLRNECNEPVKLSHLKMLQPVYFTAQRKCIKLEQNESLLLGVSQDGTNLFIWKIKKYLPLYTQRTMMKLRVPLWTSFHQTDSQNILLATSAPSLYHPSNSSNTSSFDDWIISELIVRYKVDQSMSISALAGPLSMHINDQRMHNCVTSIFTGTADGFICAWRLVNTQCDELNIAPQPNDNTCWKWTPVLYFRSSMSPISMIKCCSSGRIAAYSNDEIKIWECESSFPNYFLEAVIPLTKEGKCSVDKNKYNVINLTSDRNSTSDDPFSYLPTPQTDDRTKKLLYFLKTIKLKNEKSFYLCLNVSIALSISHFIFLPISVQNKLLNVLEKFQNKYMKEMKFEADILSNKNEFDMSNDECSNYKFDDKYSGRNNNFFNSPLTESSQVNSLNQVKSFGRHQNVSGNYLKVKMSDIDSCLKKNEIKNSHLSCSSVDFDWITGPIGVKMLAITINTAVQIWAMRYNEKLFEFEPRWEILNQVDVSCSKIIWTSFGQLVMSESNYLYVFTKSYPKNTNFITLAEEEQVALPFYHPKYLGELVVFGDFDRVQLICKILYDTIKSCLDTEGVEFKDIQTLENLGGDVVQKMEKIVVDFTESLDFCLNEEMLNFEIDLFFKNFKGPNSQNSQNKFGLDSGGQTELNNQNSIQSDDMSSSFSSDSMDLLIQPLNSNRTSSLSINSNQESLSLFGNDGDAWSESKLLEEDVRNDIQEDTNDFSIKLISFKKAKFLIKVLKHLQIKKLQQDYRNILSVLLEVFAELEPTWASNSSSMRYVLIARFFLKINQVKNLKKYFPVLSSYVWCWAVLSGNESLIAKDFLYKMSSNQFQFTWKNVSNLGIPLWCCDSDILKEFCWNLALRSFQESQNLSDVVIWYLVLDKVSALAALYKLKNEMDLYNFFSNNFQEPRWKQAALKNAYVLIRKQRFFMSVGLFVLAGKISEAIDVCLTRIKDSMLALFIIKILGRESNLEQYQKIVKHIYDTCLKNKSYGILFILRWIDNRYEEALKELLFNNYSNSTVVLMGSQDESTLNFYGESGISSRLNRESLNVFNKTENSNSSSLYDYYFPTTSRDNLYQSHLNLRVDGESIEVCEDSLCFNSGIYAIFEFLKKDPNLKSFVKSLDEKNWWLFIHEKLRISNLKSQQWFDNEYSINSQYLRCNLVFIYLYSGLTRLIMQMDFNKLAERYEEFKLLNFCNSNIKAAEWLQKTQRNYSPNLWRRMMDREIEFKCTLQFLSNEIDHRRPRLTPKLEYKSMFVVLRFFFIIMHYYPGLKVESVVMALGQFCESRLYYYQHYVLFRILLDLENNMLSFIKAVSNENAEMMEKLAELEKTVLDANQNNESDEKLVSSLELKNIRAIDSSESKNKISFFTFSASDLDNENQFNVNRFHITRKNSLKSLANFESIKCEKSFSLLNQSSMSSSNRYLIFNAQAIVSVCYDLVSNPFSLYQNSNIDKLSNELKFCLFLHFSDPNALISLKTCAGMLASIMLGQFVSPLLNSNYEVVHDLLCNIKINFDFLQELMEIRAKNENHSIPIEFINTHFKKFEQEYNKDSAQGVKSTQVNFVNLFPPPDSEKYTELYEQNRSLLMDKFSEVFLEKLLHVALIVKFTYQMVEVLSTYFPKPKSVNLIKVLEQSRLYLENQLKDIPYQIIESRLDEIRFGRSLYIFDIVFFSSFIRQSCYYRNNPVVSKLWSLICNDQNVVNYFRHADYLKQTIRFTRLHYNLERDFSEQDRTSEPKIFQMLMHDSAVTSNYASIVRSRPEPLGSSSQFKGIEGLSNVNDSFFNESSASVSCSFESISNMVCRKFFVENYLPCASLPDLNFKIVSQPVLVYKDQKPLHAFVVNPTNIKQIAIATESTLIEIIKPMRDVVEPETTTNDSVSDSKSLSTAIRVEFLDLGLYERREESAFLDGHPVYPYYLSASSEGPLKLWQFNVGQVLNVYNTMTHSRSARVRFNSNGSKICSLSVNGILELWRFDASEESLDPYLSLPCLKRGFDFQFLNTGSVLAVCGEGYSGQNLCLIDTLIAPKKSIVATMHSDHSILSLIYSPRLQMLITSNSHGTISALDMRNLAVIKTFENSSHEKHYPKQLCLDPTYKMLVSSKEKSLNFWDLLTFKELYSWKNEQTKSFQLREELLFHGVTQVALQRNEIMFCGINGKLIKSIYSVL